MELSYIGLLVVYSLQVLDAYVDANMYNWNVNNMLSMGAKSLPATLDASRQPYGTGGGSHL